MSCTVIYWALNRWSTQMRFFCPRYRFSLSFSGIAPVVGLKLGEISAPWAVLLGFKSPLQERAVRRVRYVWFEVPLTFVKVLEISPCLNRSLWSVGPKGLRCLAPLLLLPFPPSLEMGFSAGSSKLVCIVLVLLGCVVIGSFSQAPPCTIDDYVPDYSMAVFFISVARSDQTQSLSITLHVYFNNHQASPTNIYTTTQKKRFN